MGLPAMPFLRGGRSLHRSRGAPHTTDAHNAANQEGAGYDAAAASRRSYARSISVAVTMPEFQVGTVPGTLAMLFNKGLRYGTVVDLGCADGNFCVEFHHLGLFRGASCVNVDANAMYEPSLRQVQDVLGGHYVIAAVSDREGEIELQTGSHPYWASLLPADHSYWSSSHNRPDKTLTVRAVTLDRLVEELAVKPPFLLKLDLQGGELAALRGAQKMLGDTDCVIVESSPHDFPSVCDCLNARNFGLFDLAQLTRLSDGSLCEFYPAFLNRRLDHLRTGAPWSPEQVTTLIAEMDRHRRTMLDRNAKLLAEIRARGAHSAA
jgi:FkbM family methyltransferase